MIPRGATLCAVLLMCLGGLPMSAMAETATSGQDSPVIPGSPVTEATELVLGEDTRGLLGRNAPINPADGAPYRAFTIELEPGDPVRFTVGAPETQMRPTLTLYAPDGTLMGTNRPDGPRAGERSPPLIREPVMAGRHTVVVAGSRAGAQGSFTLSAETVEDNQSLSFPGDVSGILYQRDGSHPQTGSARVVYTFELDEATDVDARMQSEAFDTYLSIAPADGSGQTHHNDDGGQGTNSRIRTELPAGEYEVWAGSYSQGASGAFTLSLEESTIQEQAGLTFPGEVTGNLYQADDTHPETGSPRVLYTFELDEATDVDARMQSEAFDTYLSIAPADGSGQTHHNDDGGEGYNSRIQRQLPPGEYEVWAGAYGRDATGRFTLSLTEGSGNTPRDPESVSFPGDISGNLSQGNTNHPQTGSPRVVYTFELDEATVVDARMASEAFDTYLSIAPGNGSGEIHHNDDGGDGTNSRIQTQLPAGEHEVWAGSYYEGASGPFSLSLDAREAQEQESLTFPGEVSGQLYQGDGNHPQTGSPRVVYTFELDEATVVDARLASEAFDTYLSIAPADGDGQTYHNDDWGQGLDSRIQTELPPGEYEVWAGAFTQGATGPFTLSLEERTQREKESLTFPGEVSGHLYQSEGSHPQTGSPRVVYTFELDEATAVDARMASEAFDTYLSIAPVNGDGQTYHNDDWGQDLNSRIRTELPAGEYEVWAGAYSQGASGSFTLSVEAGRSRDQEPLTAGDERSVRISEDMLLTMPSGARGMSSGAPFPIQVEESGRLEVTIDTQNVMPYASLRQDGRTLAENSRGVEDNGPLTLRTPVEAGEYTLWLSPGSTGSAGFDGTVDLATRMVSGKG